MSTYIIPFYQVYPEKRTSEPVIRHRGFEAHKAPHGFDIVRLGYCVRQRAIMHHERTREAINEIIFYGYSETFINAMKRHGFKVPPLQDLTLFT
jgi:hypothetical protein